MNDKTDGIIKKLCNISIILFIVYILTASLINLNPAVATAIFGGNTIEDYVINQSSIIGLVITLLLFLVPFYLIRNKTVTKSFTATLFGVLLIITSIVIVFIVPTLVSYYQMHAFISQGITEECYLVWISVSKTVDLLNIFLYPAIVLLFIACFMKWFLCEDNQV